MTRGAPPASHDSGTPISGVPANRPKFVPPQPIGPASPPPGRGATFSRLLVIGLVLVFVLASAAFIISASEARPGDLAESTPASSAASPGDVGAAAPTSPGLDAPSRPGAGAGAARRTPRPGRTPRGTGSLAAAAPGDVSLLPAPSPEISASPGPDASPGPSASLDPVASIDPPASASPVPTPDPAGPGELRMPFVPVVGFWSTSTSLSRDELVSALRGESDTYRRVVVPAADRESIGKALGIRIADEVESVEPAAIERAVRRSGVLGVLRGSDLTFRVRALGIGDRTLFGNDRLRSLDDWPLTAAVPVAEDETWDQRATWTLVAGGDSFTDRGVYDRVEMRGRGVDYPFDGGFARVTGHYCCGPWVPGNLVPSYKLSGPKGIVRAMVRDADLAIANHESPVPDDWDFHLHGYTFQGKPELTQIFSRAGIDWMSLANNHITDAGTQGIIDTKKNLRKYGIKSGGAGKDIESARELSYLTVRGVRIAIIPCVGVSSWTWATRSSAGGTPCKDRFMLPDIREAASNADVVIVFPHWGVEYSRSATPGQREQAADWVAAGADIVIGSHSHVAGAIEEVDDAPVFYSLGNFLFDQNWATYTMESYLVEMTFLGDRLVQFRLHPFLSHDQSQPHFLDPAKDDGKALLRAVREASYIDW